MRRHRIGNPFPAAVVACLRAGRAPTADELRSVAERIEQEADLHGRFSDEPDRRVRTMVRAALLATGMIELGPKDRDRP